MPTGVYVRKDRKGASGQSISCTAFTPTAGDGLIVAVVTVANVTDPAITDTQNLGWTKLGASRLFGGGTHKLTMWAAQAGAAASSETITADLGAGQSMTDGWIVVYAAQGATHFGSLAVVSGQVASDGDNVSGATTVAPTFPVAAQSTNYCICTLAVSTTNGDTSAFTGWTVDFSDVFGGGSANTWSQHMAGFTGTTPSTTEHPSAGATYTDILIELDFSAAGGGTPDPVHATPLEAMDFLGRIGPGPTMLFQGIADPVVPPVITDIIIAAPVASANFDVPAVTVQEVVNSTGVVATATFSAPTPSYSWNAAPAAATTTFSFPTPSVLEIVVSPVLSCTFNAPGTNVAWAPSPPAASCSYSMLSPTVSMVAVEPSGTCTFGAGTTSVLHVMSGFTAGLVTFDAPTPTIPGLPINVAPPSANTNFSFPTPTVADQVQTPVGSTTFSAPATTVAWKPLPSVGNVNYSLPVPTVSETVVGTVGNATFSSGAQTIKWVPLPPPGSATYSLPAPNVNWTPVAVVPTTTFSAPPTSVKVAAQSIPGTVTFSAPAPTLPGSGFLIQAPSGRTTFSAPVPYVFTYYGLRPLADVTRGQSTGSVSRSGIDATISRETIEGVASRVRPEADVERNL